MNDEHVYRVARDPNTHSLEARVNRVTLLTCGCLRAESRPQRDTRPDMSYDRLGSPPRVLPLDELRVEVILDTSALTGNNDRLSGLLEHRHGDALVDLPIAEWYEQTVTAGLPNTGGFTGPWGRRR